jgi:hypothetical protein
MEPRAVSDPAQSRLRSASAFRTVRTLLLWVSSLRPLSRGCAQFCRLRTCSSAAGSQRRNSQCQQRVALERKVDRGRGRARIVSGSRRWRGSFRHQRHRALAQPRRIAFAFLGQVDHELGERDRRRVFAVADTELAQRAVESLCEDRNVLRREPMARFEKGAVDGQGKARSGRLRVTASSSPKPCRPLYTVVQLHFCVRCPRPFRRMLRPYGPAGIYGQNSM